MFIPIILSLSQDLFPLTMIVWVNDKFKWSVNTDHLNSNRPRGSEVNFHCFVVSGGEKCQLPEKLLKSLKYIQLHCALTNLNWDSTFKPIFSFSFGDEGWTKTRQNFDEKGSRSENDQFWKSEH